MCLTAIVLCRNSFVQERYSVIVKSHLFMAGRSSLSKNCISIVKVIFLCTFTKIWVHLMAKMCYHGNECVHISEKQYVW